MSDGNLAMANFITDTPSEVQELLAENEKLEYELQTVKDKLREAVEVIRFYGDINNCEVCRVTHIDFEKFPSMSGGLYMTGRRAREFLTKHQLNSEEL